MTHHGIAKLILRASFSGCVVLAAPAIAQITYPQQPHFILRVPLEVSNLEEWYKSVGVLCRIFDRQKAGMGMYDSRVNVDQKTGNPVEKTAEVHITFRSGVDPRNADSYTCSFFKFEADRVGNQIPPGPPWDTSKPLVQEVSGKLQ